MFLRSTISISMSLILGYSAVIKTAAQMVALTAAQLGLAEAVRSAPRPIISTMNVLMIKFLQQDQAGSI
jgi:hypothetical protein